MGKVTRGQGEMQILKSTLIGGFFVWVGARLRRVLCHIQIVLTKAGPVEKLKTVIYRIL